MKTNKEWIKYKELIHTRPSEFLNNGPLTIITDEAVVDYFEFNTGKTIGVLYDSPYHILVVDLVKNKSGKMFAHERVLPAVEKSAAVFVPVYHGQFVLLRQYRHSLRNYQYAFSRGFAKSGFSTEENLKKEVFEETGGILDQSYHLGSVVADSGFESNPVDIFLCTLKEMQFKENDENIEDIILLSESELRNWILSGKINDGFTLAAFEMYETFQHKDDYIKVIHTKTLHEAVEQAMVTLNSASVVSGENQDKNDQLKDIPIVIEVDDIRNITISKAIPGDLYSLVEYELEFIDGVRDFETEWEYTYHKLFMRNYANCIAELKRNHNTRRAVLPIAGKESYGNPHPPCMQLIMFRIIDNKLNTTVIFRSNDGVKAFAMNSFAIALLAKKVAAEVGVEVGRYIHISNSFHAYSKDWDVLDSYIKMFYARDPESLYFSYEDYLEAKEEHEEKYRMMCQKRKEEKAYITK